ncbi:MAG TPA: sigma-70 family RNA polymerase sigma factor [Pseudonocardiaceae bacterium]
MSSSEADGARITELALQARAGDRGAAALFVRVMQRDVLRFVTHLAGRAEAEDLTQETFFRALRALPGFQGRSSARTWLLTIARRTVVDHIRATTRRPRLVPVPDWVTTADARADDEESRIDEHVLVNRLIAQLDQDRREAFVATQVLGLSYAEAAEVCGCPVGTIRSRVARARDDLVAAWSAGAPPRAEAAAGHL